MRDNTPQPEEPDPAAQDAALVRAWLHGRSPHTQRGYRGDLAAFRRLCPRPLAEVALADLQAFDDALAERGLSPASRCRMLASLKSLLKFGCTLGLLPRDAGAALRLPKRKDDLAERILDEIAVRRLLAAATTPRDTALLRLLYTTGVRVSELCALCWSDVTPRGTAAVLTVFGKGGKTRRMVLPPSAWALVAPLRPVGYADGPVFRSRRGGHLSPQQARKIVLAAARAAGLAEHVSPHWLRHSSATHALENGASLALVRDSLGHANISTTSKYLHARPDKGLGDFLAG